MEISTKKVIFLAISVGIMGALLAAAMFGQAVQQDNVYKYLSVFSEVFSIVRTNYVDEVSPDTLVDGAFQGVTQAVDEFSYYVPPAEMAAYRQFLDARELIDPGMVISKRFGYAFVLGVDPGAAAEKAGIKAGDFIEKIEDRDTADMAVWQIQAALHARDGEARNLVVVRGGGTKREEVILTLSPKDDVPLEEKTYGRVGYVKIPNFQPGVADRVEERLVALRAAGTDALILDVRGNSTGDVEESIRVADLLLSGGTITSIAGRKADAQVWQADRETVFDGEVVVLTDSSCAEGAAVLAAAISGNQRGQVVGLTTYGRAIVQRMVDLPSGGGLFITIGHYTKPDLEPIKQDGIRPDVVVDRSAWDNAKGEDGEDVEKPDPILEKALSLLEVVEEEKAAA
jgi:carboxyl-terminal processing protease